MKSSKNSLFVHLLLFFVFSCGTSQVNSQKKSEQPNIILIMVDDMGYSDIGCYGGEIETPNLDKLAADGIRFTQMHNTSKCFPSRATLLTGVYAQQANMGVKPKSFKNTISLGDLLKTKGYNTYFSGKNHSGTSLYNFGFDHVYEFFGGATNHFNPGSQRKGEPEPIFKGGPDTWNIDNKAHKPYVTDADFYSTDYFTKHANEFIDQGAESKDPFFLYLAYTAPHDPLMAWPKDIAKYRGKYKQGYQAIRETRYKKMLELGMVDPNMKLSESTFKSWDSLSEEQKDKEDLKMAIYAAMIDCVDQNIGKLIERLKDTNQLDNTLILFASDNGSSAENAENNISQAIYEPGTVAYWASLQKNWANVSNTPYRYHKGSSYEGGICTPFIAYWPGKIINKGMINNDPLHFIDIIPTLQQITKATYPKYFRSQVIAPMQGESFLPVLLGDKASPREKPIFWQWSKGKAVRVGEWKAVAVKNIWALYNMKYDRNETNDVSSIYPDKMNELLNKYTIWSIKMVNNNK